MNGWEHPAAAEYYEEFCRRHGRYDAANAALVSRAALGAGMRVLDLGAGTGRTTEAVLPLVGSTGQIVCVEPAEPMRSCGMRRIADERVKWRCDLPETPAAFDRILSCAAIWQLTPLQQSIEKLSALLAPGGALCFNIPALYLGEPDDPGGGRDPLLLQLPALLWESRSCSGEECGRQVSPLTVRPLTGMLHRAHLRPQSWRFRYRLTQSAFADWMKIPVLTERLFPGVDVVERALRIDRALAAADTDSWKWERWRGWTAWKH